jgi:Phage integrase, N-terminal SAM-like domain
MSDKPVSDLRRRMIADMTVRSIGDKTQRDYIRHIETFARFLGRSPNTASGDDIRRFQLAPVEQGAHRAAPGGKDPFRGLGRVTFLAITKHIPDDRKPSSSPSWGILPQLDVL